MVGLSYVFILSNCGKDSPTKPATPTTPTTPATPTAPVPSRITITPASATLNALGQTIQLKAAVVATNNNPIPGAVVSWSSANTAVAAVSAQGLVTAVANGNAQITAQAGSLTGRANVTVAQAASRVLIMPTSATLNEIGQTVQLKANVVDAKNNSVPDTEVSWSSANTTIATVNAHGLVTAVANGITQITARSESISGRITITVMGPDLEREALVQLFNSTDGPNWTNKGGWLSEGPLASWYGVSTNEIGRVTRLILHENNLRGTLISELGQLSSLDTLAFSDNQLTGIIPSELGQLTNLTLLYLWGNQLTGTIPIGLTKLTGLEHFSLASNQLTGNIPPDLGRLTNLTRLNLGNNQLTGQIPSEFGQLTNLTELLLGKNSGLSGPLPTSLKDLQKLTELDLSDTRLCVPIDTDMQAWAMGIDTTRGIKYCDSDADRQVLIAFYNATDGPDWTENSGWLSDQILNEWHGVTTDANGRVTRLSLHENSLRGTLIPELGMLASVETLALSSNQLTGNIPPEIGQLANLKLLYLWGNQLTETIPQELGQLTRLEKLDLSSNQLTGNIPPEIGQLTQLTRLNLYNNQLTGNIPEEIGQLTQLSELLSLASNQLTGNIPPELVRLTNLTELILASNLISGDIPPELGQLANLTKLNLHTNELTGTIPPDLGYLTLLTQLSLANNRLTGALEPELLQLVNLTELQLQGTQVCAPADVEFMDWLSGIAEQNVASCADVTPGLAPANQREFDARFAGKVLSTTRGFDIEFTAEGRYAEPVGEPPAGSYTYSITGTNTGRVTQIYDASELRCFTALTFTAPTKGDFAYRCGTRTQYDKSGLWRITNAPDPDSFDIEIVWVDEEPDAFVAEVAKTAAARWERVIRGDLPDERFQDVITEDDLFDNGNYEQLFGYVDDLVIYLRFASIDGQGGTLAYASPYLVRPTSSLPFVGGITFDTDDLAGFSPVALHDTILHEMAHVLGFGSSIWKRLDLLRNSSLDANHQPILPPPDTHFNGINAVAAFDAVGGIGYSGAKVPVENEEGGKGTQDVHWRNSVIGPKELMDGFGNPEATTHDPMSLITVQSLSDLGYVVDETQADAYLLPTKTLARRLTGTSEHWIPLNCVVR